MPNATVRANAKATPIDRRAAVSGLAALGALLAAPRAAKGSPGPSRVALAYAKFLTVKSSLKEACVVESEAIDRYKRPDPPTFSDMTEHSAYEILQDEDGRWRTVLDVSEKNIESLRDLIHRHCTREDGVDASRIIAGMVAALGRIEAYRSECKRLRDAAGLTEASAICDDLCEKSDEAAEGVLALEPESVADLAMQADVALRHGDDGDPGRVLRALIAFAGLVSPNDSLASPADFPAAS
jgi:hypothetical protein